MNPTSNIRYFTSCFSSYCRGLLLPRFWSRRHLTLLAMTVALANLLRMTLAISLASIMPVLADQSYHAVDICLVDALGAVAVLLTTSILVSALAAGRAVYLRQQP